MNQIDQLKSDCDLNALELYLMLRMFIDHLVSSLKLTSLIVKKYCLTPPVILAFLLLSYSSNATSDLLFLLVSVGIGTILFYNVMFISIAAFESNCNKTLQRIFSLVANMIDEHKVFENINILKPSYLPPSNSHRMPAQFKLAKENTSLINGETTLL